MPRTALSLTLEERAWPCPAIATKGEILCSHAAGTSFLDHVINSHKGTRGVCPGMAANVAQLNWFSQGKLYVSGIWVQSAKGWNRFELVIFVLILWNNSSSLCDEGEERRAGGIGLLVAPNTASYLVGALPESRQADLYSDNPQNKC